MSTNFTIIMFKNILNVISIWLSFILFYFILFYFILFYFILQNTSATVEAQTTVSQASVESVMRAIHQRLKARIALCRQVQALGKGPCNCHQN